MMTFILERVWKILISLRLAVLVISGLALALTTATLIESKYDTATAQYLVYRSTWFFCVLGLLGLNILAVAISRLPWKWKHTPFLMAHAGILMILTGSWLTYTKGVDGSLRVSEGEVTSAVEMDQHLLVFKRGEEISSEPFPWMPAFAAESFKPKVFPTHGITVERFIPDAEPKINFVTVTSTEASESKQKAAPALEIKILGSPMGGAPEFWLWAGDPAWSTQKLGPARFLVRTEDQKIPAAEGGDSGGMGEARIDFIVGKDGSLRYESTSIRGEKKNGKIKLGDGPSIVNPEWKMPIQVQVKKLVLNSVNQTEYLPMKVKPVGMGTALPNPAILISLTKNPSSKLWLGIGDRAEFTDTDGTPISVGYFPKRIVLPFALRLKEFEMKHNPGTMDPAAYSSYVQVVDAFQKTEADLDHLPVQHITMNEPIKVKEYTFYQASYIPDFPRPTTTILSVNYDPGRFLKYTGSLLLICGAILLYAIKAIRTSLSKNKSNQKNNNNTDIATADLQNTESYS